MDGVGFVALRKDGMFRRPAFERLSGPGSVRNRWALNPLRGFRTMYHPSTRGGWNLEAYFITRGLGPTSSARPPTMKLGPLQAAASYFSSALRAEQVRH